MDPYHYPMLGDSQYTPSATSRFYSSYIVAILKCGKQFCKETSIHGFNHIAAPGRHWVERLLWLTVCGLAIWMALNVSIGQLQRYNESPTVVTLEKDFRSWQFSMPAITSCYMDRLDRAKLPAVIKKHFNVEEGDKEYSYYKELVYVIANSDVLNLHTFTKFQDVDTPVDMFQIAVDVAPEVKIKTVASEAGDWKWWPVMTEAGLCYVINSLAFTDMAIVKPSPNETASSPVMCKNSVNNCYLVLDNYAVANYYVHSPYDVMDITSEPSLAYLSLTRESELSIMESRCGRGVKELQPKRRGCLYTDEPSQEGRKVYSTNSCRLSCRSRISRKLCGCVPFYYFYEDGPRCTPAGMACLSRYHHNLTRYNGEKCVCAPQCVDSVFKEINSKDQNWDKPPFSSRGSIKFVVQGPRTRYTREIVFHFQDLVVSFGGAAGLFLGASFISFIEILYFFFTKIFSLIIKRDVEQKKSVVKIIKNKIPHETLRLKHLTAILESEKNYYY